MDSDRGAGERRNRDGRDWRIGTAIDVRWIEEKTEHGVRIDCAVPLVFEAYATLELPDSGNGEALDFHNSEQHDDSVIAVLSRQTPPQPWWLGYLETSGSSKLVFDDAPRVTLYAHWPYVIVEAGPEQARNWRGDDWKGWLPDLIFPADHSWLFTTLWDDDWSYIGGSRTLVDAFLAHPELGGRVHEVDPSMKDATPPGHVAF